MLKRESGVRKATGSYRTYSSLVKLQPGFLNCGGISAFERNCGPGSWVCNGRPAIGQNFSHVAEFALKVLHLDRTLMIMIIYVIFFIYCTFFLHISMPIFHDSFALNIIKKCNILFLRLDCSIFVSNIIKIFSILFFVLRL